MMLHKHCDKTYFLSCHFNGHFKSKLRTLADKLGKSFDTLVFSTDEDKRCVSVLDYLFPENIKFLCTRRVRNSFIGICTTTSGTLVSRLNDVMNSSSLVEFNRNKDKVHKVLVSEHEINKILVKRAKYYGRNRRRYVVLKG